MHPKINTMKRKKYCPHDKHRNDCEVCNPVEEKDEFKPNLEQSEHMATTINHINMILAMRGFDIEYAKKAVEGFQKDASMQDSMAALSAKYNPDKTSLIRQKAQVLESLIKYVELSIEVGAVQSNIEDQEKAQSELDQLFS